MRRMIVLSTSILLAVFAAGNGGAKEAAAGQVSTNPQQGTSQSSHPSVLDQDNGAPDAFKDRLEAQAARSRNSERHKKMVADTDKLLQLSTELKADVDKTTKDEMSVQVIQKAAEIEKLAHDVKERMRGQ